MERSVTVVIDGEKIRVSVGLRDEILRAKKRGDDHLWYNGDVNFDGRETCFIDLTKVSYIPWYLWDDNAP